MRGTHLDHLADLTMTAPVEPRWLRRLSGYVLKHRKLLVLGLIGAAVGSVTQALVPLVTTARTAHRIIVLDHGRVAEIGSHDELLEAAGGYARMWRACEFVGH